MSGPPLRHLAGSLFALWLAATAVCAQTVEPQAPLPFTTVRSILALPAEVLEEGKTPVRLHGVITDVSTKRDGFSLHDGTTSISMTLLQEAVAANVGDEVEIEGRAFSQPFADRLWTRVEAAKITVLGQGTVPEPARATVPEVSDFKRFDQWVSVEGVVLQLKYSAPLLTIQLSNDKKWCNVLVRNWPRDNIPNNWVGATVRVVGVNHGYTHTSLYSMMVPAPERVTVLKPGVMDPFDAPATTVAALRNSGKGTSERRKLRGILINTTPAGVSYLRETDGSAFSLYPLYPLDEDKSGRLSTPVTVPDTKPGDVLEVVGSPSYVDPGVHLNYAQFRVVDSQSLPEPAPTDIAGVLGGKFPRDFVELHGRLVSTDEVAISLTRWRTTLRIEDGGHVISADLDAPKRGALENLHPDHLVKVRAVVGGWPQYPETRLLLPTSEDVESLGISSAVIARRVWAWGSVAALCIIPLSVWVLMLRRSRTAIHELNASLEKRVEERTAELAAAKDELSKSLSQERDLNELKTRFISLVSHEFRTPLGITMSAVELMRHYSDRLAPEKLTELLDDIHGSTLRMSGLMEQVLILGRVEAGKAAYKPTPLNLEELCEKLTDEGLSATHRRCPVDFTAEGDLAHVQADEGLIRHIFSNLLSNAVKYSPEGDHVEFTVHRENGHAVFKVQDHGIGIPEADKARMFEAFHRASNVGEIPGTGLGLLLVKRCVDLHLGNIEVDSVEGKGTTITVKLPVEGDMLGETRSTRDIPVV